MAGDDDALAAKFALVDASFCFLARHRAVLSVRNVLRTANSFGVVAISAAELRAMAALAPALLTIEASTGHELQHKDDVFRAAAVEQDEKDIVAFPSVPQLSQRASTKRKQLFQAAIDSASAASLAGESQSAAVPVKEATPSIPGNATRLLEDASANGSANVVGMLRQLDIYRGQIVHVERLPAREAQCRELNDLPELDERVVAAVLTAGVSSLYSHQFDAIRAVLDGQNVVLSTSTASGKSLAYNIPMGDMLVRDPQATFLYLFPTKALAQDQLKSLRRFLSAAGLSPALGNTFDGDTAMKGRSMVIKDTSVFLTNPDMLHLTILPQHTRWRRVLSNLKLIVVDEAHMYRGVFGSHVACVFRRLFRLCALHGSSPQVVCCSATIQNPAEHFRLLLPLLPPEATVSSVENQGARHGDDAAEIVDPLPPNLHFFRARKLKVITSDGAPRGEKLFCMWNPKAPPAVNNQALSPASPASATAKSSRKKRKLNQPDSRASANQSTSAPTGQNEQVSTDADAIVSTSSIFQSATIFARLMEAQVHTLLFCRGRKLSELVLMNVHSILRETRDESVSRRLLKKISTYRGGYTIEDRRAIERRLFSGELLGVVATNALELGIDIGELDCTMHLGLPSSIASLWQQAGRAGRQHTQQSIAIIVCFDAPLDQHFARHAPELFQLKPEAVTLNPQNVRILSQHLVCAARESPLYSSQTGLRHIDTYVFGPLDDGILDSALRSLLGEHKLMRWSEGGGGWSYRLHSCVPKKAKAVNLRSINEITYTVVTDSDEMAVLDSIPGERVFFQVYPTAVYLHQAQEYLITRVDNDKHVVYAKKCPEPLTYFTTCRDYTDVDVVQVQREKHMRQSLLVVVGVVSMLTRVFGSLLLEKKTMRLIHKNEFSLPPMQSFGCAVWFEFPRELREKVEDAGINWIAALHGVGHLCIALVRLFVMCDALDIGTEHHNPFERRVRPNRITLYEKREGGSGLVEEIVKVLPDVVDKAWTIANECTCADGCPGCIHSAECSEYNSVLDKLGSLMVLEYLHEVFVASVDVDPPATNS